jgi:hypothetical protein
MFLQRIFENWKSKANSVFLTNLQEIKENIRRFIKGRGLAGNVLKHPLKK